MRICGEIAAGMSLKKICQQEGMPHRTTVLNWLDAYPEFASVYARARESQADVMDDLILEAAENVTAADANAMKVKIDAYKWRAGRLKPRVYGDKIAVTGGDGGPIKSVNANVAVPTDPVEAARVYREMMGRD